MFAVYAQGFSQDDPLSGLGIGERPEPEVPDGWTTVTVKAASINHHDVWSLRGVGLKEERAADDPRLRRRGSRRGRQRGARARRHQQTRTGAATRRSTPSGRCCPSATRARSPRRSPCRGATSSRSRRGCRSSRRPACRPRGSPPTGCSSPSPACSPATRCSCRAPAAASPPRSIALARAAGFRVYATSRDEDKRARALEIGAHEVVRDRRAAADQGRRRDGDGRRGHVVALGQVAAPRRHARRLRRHLRRRLTRRADPHLLPADAGASARRWAPATSCTVSRSSWTSPASGR